MSRPSSAIADTNDYVAVRGAYAPTAQDVIPPEPPVDHQDTLAVGGGNGKGEPMSVHAGPHHDIQPAGGGEGGGGDLRAETTVTVGGDTPHVAANNSPPIASTSRFNEVCPNLNRQQLEECTDLLLELLGWGVPLEYIADSGFSLPGVIWLCAKLKIRLSWGIVKRARQACIPLHELSILPEGYVGPKPKPPPPPPSSSPAPLS